MEQWEYNVGKWDNWHLADINEIANFLNDFGEAGWELVSVAVSPKVSGRGAMGSTDIHTSFYTVMIFKRPKLSRED